MGILKDVGDALVKYGDVLVNKTEEYTRIAKLSLDIKRLEGRRDDIYRDVGRQVIEGLSGDETSFTRENEFIAEKLALVSDLESVMEQKNAELNTLKQESSQKPGEEDPVG